MRAVDKVQRESLRGLALAGRAVKIKIPLLVCAVVVLPVSYADTQAIKLTCDLDVTTQPPDGEVKQSRETAVVVMLFDASTGFKAITIHSVAIPVAVANKKGARLPRLSITATRTAGTSRIAGIGAKWFQRNPRQSTAIPDTSRLTPLQQSATPPNRSRREEAA